MILSTVIMLIAMVIAWLNGSEMVIDDGGKTELASYPLWPVFASLAVLFLVLDLFI